MSGKTKRKKKGDEEKKPSRFGWCLDGHHGQCRGSFASALGVQQGQVVSCGCPCHGEED